MDPILLKQCHPLYRKWAPTWRLLGDVFEGDGGFLDGSYLVPHPREVEYEVSVVSHTNDAGETIKTTVVNYDRIVRETQKFKRRKALARYENFAAIIGETLLAYLYAKAPSRVIKGASTGHPLEAWWQNVDGEGTHVGDWLPYAHLLAAIYGHTLIAMDRPVTNEPPRSKADQRAPFLRVYGPLDMPDWIAEGREVRAAKFIEAISRTTLDQSATPLQQPLDGAALGDGARQDVQWRLWDETSWRVYDNEGALLDSGDHQMGEVPVVVLQGRPRALVRLIGRSVLGDPRLYKDHFNLLSEQRALERDQTFSILNIPLGPEQTLDDAKALAGDTVGTTNALFTRDKAAAFIAPPDAPLAHYREQVTALERKIYRLVGLPWDGDSKQAETAESRKIKALDLNRLLASMADEAERVEYQLARLWFLAMEGPEKGEAAYEASGLSIKYPDEFQTQEILDVIAELRAKLSAGLGKTANTIARRRALPVLLPDLTQEETATVSAELESTPVSAADAASQFRGDLMKMVGQQGQPAAGDRGAPVQ